VFEHRTQDKRRMHEIIKYNMSDVHYYTHTHTHDIRNDCGARRRKTNNNNRYIIPDPLKMSTLWRITAIKTRRYYKLYLDIVLLRCIVHCTPRCRDNSNNNYYYIFQCIRYCYYDVHACVIAENNVVRGCRKPKFVILFLIVLRFYELLY